MKRLFTVATMMALVAYAAVAAEMGLLRGLQTANVFIDPECPPEEDAFGICPIEGKICFYEYRKVPTVNNNGKCTGPFECQSFKKCECGEGEWRCLQPGFAVPCETKKTELKPCKPN